MSLVLAPWSPPAAASCDDFRARPRTPAHPRQAGRDPGYQTIVPREKLEAALRKAGGRHRGREQRDRARRRRLYAIRDVTRPSIDPLICASILSKKLAAGLDAMVLDIKVGNGAFAPTLPFARAMASALNEVRAARPEDRRVVTDMNQVLGSSCGNAVEVLEAVRFMKGEAAGPAPGTRDTDVGPSCW